MTRSLDDWLQRLESLHPKAIDLGLERCAEVYHRLGAPRPARRIWTVAGTNGKGSVTTYLAGMLAACGHAVGHYTSPHIARFNERIRINGIEVGDDAIVAALERVEQARGDVSLTYFEFTTLAAFLLFAGRDLDAAVLEVGLGGRLDAVNVVDPDCAVITPIGIDHQEFLGADRDVIALEKGGIMRSGHPVVIGDPDPPKSLAGQVRRVGALPQWLGRDFHLEKAGPGARFSGPGISDLAVPPPPLPGSHQWDNLATALAAFFVLLPPADPPVQALAQGISGVRLPGRLQPWPEDERLLLDVGHNPLAAAAVADFLRDSGPGRNVCVLGMLADKDAEGVTRQLSPVVSDWYCAGLGGARGQGGEALAARVRAQLDKEGRESFDVRSFADVGGALDAARNLAGDGGRIVVFGSFLTVAAALAHLGEARPPAG